MRGVRFTKAERQLLTTALTNLDWSPASQKIVDSITSKLEVAEMPVKKAAAGVTVTAAIEAFRGVLGSRLIAPPFSAVGVLGQMKSRLGALGLTLRDCETVAKVAAAQWRGPVKAESLVRQADTLLAASQQEISWGATPKAGTVELSDDDI